MNACLFIVSTETSFSTQHQYAKTLHALFRRFGWDARSLSMMAAGPRPQGRPIPGRQAPPFPFPELLLLLEHPRMGDLRLPIMLAWASASRWDDIFNLDMMSFLEHSPKRTIIAWSDRTKTSKDDPFRASAYTVVAGKFAEAIHNALVQLNATSPDARITTCTTGALDKRTKAAGFPWTGHSFKRGAATALVCLAAEGRYDVMTLPLLLKHKTPEELSATTIRYVSAHVALALALGTQHSTIHL